MAFHPELLPAFPWDSLAPARARAAQHPGGAVDLTIGTPVDGVPALAQQALGEASDSHGYPETIGSPALREAIAHFLATERGCSAEAGILPTLGSKEIIGLLPSLLGFGAGDTVAFPHIAYPTYDVGARLAGCATMPLDVESDPATWPSDIAMLWLNSPANPNGHVLSLSQLQRIVAWARECGSVIASDECYANLCWQVDEAPSVLDSRVIGGDATGILMAYSLSKRSNMAGYRASFLAGDAQLIASITELRRHLGFMMPGPVQHAMACALGDSTHATQQKSRYRARRELLLSALDSAGLHADADSVAGLYLWACGPEGADCWDIVNACARLGVIVTPGIFYGEAGREYVRLSLTASDDAIAEAARRFAGLPGELSA